MNNEEEILPEDTNEEQPQDGQETDKPKRGISAAAFNAITGSATERVRAGKVDNTLATTGTNIIYEGPTAPGGGGSVGTGYASGQSATGSDITGNSENDARTKAAEPTGEESENDDEADASENDTIGNP